MENSQLIGPSGIGKTLYIKGMIVDQLTSVIPRDQPILVLDRGNNYRDIAKLFGSDLVGYYDLESENTPQRDDSKSIVVINYPSHESSEERKYNDIAINFIRNNPRRKVIVDECWTFESAFLQDVSQISTRTMYIGQDKKDIPDTIICHTQYTLNKIIKNGVSRSHT